MKSRRRTARRRKRTRAEIEAERLVMRTAMNLSDASGIPFIVCLAEVKDIAMMMRSEALEL